VAANTPRNDAPGGGRTMRSLATRRNTTSARRPAHPCPPVHSAKAEHDRAASSLTVTVECERQAGDGPIVDHTPHGQDCRARGARTGLDGGHGSPPGIGSPRPWGGRRGRSRRTSVTRGGPFVPHGRNQAVAPDARRQRDLAVKSARHGRHLGIGESQPRPGRHGDQGRSSAPASAVRAAEIRALHQDRRPGAAGPRSGAGSAQRRAPRAGPRSRRAVRATRPGHP
jgi:hypothetical protein